MLPNCDCGTCCEQCGHYDDCIRRDLSANAEPVSVSDDNWAAAAYDGRDAA